MTAADKLADLLEASENKLAELQQQLDEDSDRDRWGWTQHAELPKEQTLPVPRLEIFYMESESDDYNRVWLYRMIYRHLLGHCVAVPMGQTKQGGGNHKVIISKLLDFLPFRDGAHIKHDARAFGWPAFMVYGDHSKAIDLTEGK